MLRGQRSQDSGEGRMRQKATPVAGQVQVGDVGKKDGRVGGDTGEAVVVEAERLEAGHVPEPLPGEGGQ